MWNSRCELYALLWAWKYYRPLYGLIIFNCQVVSIILIYSPNTHLDISITGTNECEIWWNCTIYSQPQSLALHDTEKTYRKSTWNLVCSETITTITEKQNCNLSMDIYKNKMWEKRAKLKLQFQYFIIMNGCMRFQGLTIQPNCCYCGRLCTVHLARAATLIYLYTDNTNNIKHEKAKSQVKEKMTRKNACFKLQRDVNEESKMKIQHAKWQQQIAGDDKIKKKVNTENYTTSQYIKHTIDLFAKNASALDALVDWASIPISAENLCCFSPFIYVCVC